MDPARFDRLTRVLAGQTTRRTALGSALAGALASVAGRPRDYAAARAAIPAVTPATPGASPAAGAKPVFMFVQTARSGRGEVNPAAGIVAASSPSAVGTPIPGGVPVPGGGAPFLLTLEGHTGQTIYFSDRPERIVGAAPSDKFLPGLGFTPANPPNAALVAEFKSGQGVVVLKLIEPVYDVVSGTLIYGADTLQGYAGDNLAPVTKAELTERLPATFGAAALFIDDCPVYTNCAVQVWYIISGKQYSRIETVGPIPGGPYQACFNGTACAPCTTTFDDLYALCNNAYPDACEGLCYVS